MCASAKTASFLLFSKCTLSGRPVTARRKAPPRIHNLKLSLHSSCHSKLNFWSNISRYRKEYWQASMWFDWFFMILSYMIGINEILKLTEGQGHKVKVIYAIIRKNCLGFKSQTDDCIFIKLIRSIYIYATLKVR